MEASEAPPIECTTDKTFTMLGINTQGARNSIQEDMLTEPEGIRHLKYEDTEGIQAACGRYTNRTLAVKYQCRLGETTNIFNDVDEPKLRTMIEEANKQESCRKEQKIKSSRNDHR